MLKKERQSFILRQVNLHNKVLSSDLSEEMKVSEDTIRRDLNELSEEDKVIKVHGGALSKSFHLSLRSPNIYSKDKKKVIAQKAASLVMDGMFVLTSGGTTLIELARALPAELSATFITGSLPLAYEYILHPRIEVIFIGDKISKSAQISVGGEAISKIMGIKADLCFMGINAIDTCHGLSDNDWDVVQVKRAMIDSSAKVVAMTISEKLGSSQPIRICGLDELDIIITELEPENELLEPYRQAGVSIL